MEIVQKYVTQVIIRRLYSNFVFLIKKKQFVVSFFDLASSYFLYITGKFNLLFGNFALSSLFFLFCTRNLDCHLEISVYFFRLVIANLLLPVDIQDDRMKFREKKLKI